MSVTAVARHVRHEYWPRWVSLFCLTAGLFVLLAAAGCGKNRARAQGEAEQPPAIGTISGTVRGPQRAVPVEGRIVEVVNLDTNERRQATTNDAGAFTLRVKPGKYRVVLLLRDGESLVKAPGVTEVSRTTGGAQAHFVIGTVHLSRPRTSPYRVDDGLGSPIA
jgi:hypothetical protein